MKISGPMRLSSHVSIWQATACAAGVLWMAPARAQELTFGRDIAPIIYANCAACHRAGEAGPFPLLSYQDVKKHARDIVKVTRSRYMPPWLPAHGYGDFEGERRLSDEQIRAIATWVSQGAPEGAGETPAPPVFTDGWRLGPPDLVLQAQAAFPVPASGPDLYWNFVFHPAVSATRYVRAVEIRPGNRNLVHHANLLVDRMGSLEARGGGFPGMDLTLFRSPFAPDGNFLFWKPGSAPHVEPDGFAWRLDPGNQLVLNTHVHPSGKAEELRPSIGLYFTDQPQTNFPLLVQLENDQALDIPAGAAHFTVSEQFRLPMDAEVLAIYPHAHYLGKRLEAYATLPGGGRTWLILIPDWDPNWQAVYYYRQAVLLPKNTVISMRYQYDNSSANVRNPNQPPKRVRAGDQSTDEMAHLWLELLPRGAGDRRRELEEALMRHRLERDPADFEANFNLGVVMLSRLNAAGAVTALRTAVRVRPDRADAHNMLGLALAGTGRSAEALEQYQRALEINPGYSGARLNRANALVKSGKLEEAIRDYRAVMEAAPGDPQPKRALARALLLRAQQLSAEGKAEDAKRLLDEAQVLDPPGQAR
ncbi:MAG TPA: tetratricopeptide repeat protein [Bryobacteraceae bacterium]|nr:tetratricopeptide repeat protein [Bryobacteraceae bacterium]